MIRLAILGLGTVGQATLDILEERREQIKQALGQEVQVQKILVRRPENYGHVAHLLAQDIQEIIQDPDIQVIIEVTGEVEGMIDPIRQALAQGKQVITANKALVSRYLEDLEDLAEKNQVQIRYEAAVGGALPVLGQLDQITSLNQVDQVVGVLNGTCNFILSQMEEGQTYDQALEEAQRLGFAEADPTADVSGLDTLRKLRILASLAFQEPVREEDIDLEGIQGLTPEDLAQALEEGQRYKLVARAQRTGGAQVGPEKVPRDSVLGGLEGGENAVILSTSHAQDLAFKGQGAGGGPTAFAVLSDLLALYS